MSDLRSVISYITLGVTDLAKMGEFYTVLGFELYKRCESDHPFVMYKSGALILALYPKHLLAKQSGFEINDQDRNNAMSMSLNVEFKEEVDVLLSMAIQQGAEITRECFEPAWGGYCGYFKDPEGNLWEIVWNEKFVFSDKVI